VESGFKHNKPNRHDIAEILLKVVSNIINQTNQPLTLHASLISQNKWQSVASQQFYMSYQLVNIHLGSNRMGGVMVNELACGAGERGIESRSGQTKHYKIGIRCFSTNHTALRRKSKDSESR
jgi:hypothetical protein